MRRHFVVYGVAFAGLAAFAVFCGWAFFAASKIGDGWRGLAPIWPYVVGGVVITGGLAGFLLWLAFYSANHGFDDRIDQDEP